MVQVTRRERLRAATEQEIRQHARTLLATQGREAVTLRAIARELGETGFGDFIFGLSLSTVLFTAAGFGTDELIAREVARNRESVHHRID